MPPPRRLLLLLLAPGLLLLTGCFNDVQQPPPPTRADFTHYVALGDTFTAAPYTGKTAGRCKRSGAAYPVRVGKLLKVRSVTSVACVQAASASVTHPQRLDGHRIPPQADAVGSSADLITINVGANDGKLFTNIQKNCSADQECALSKAAAWMSLATAQVRQSLDRAIRAVQAASPQAVILVVGYPRHVDRSSRCRALPETTRADVRAWAAAEKALNLQLSRSARDTGTTFVDVYGASRGHGICSRKPWVLPGTTDRLRGVAFGPTRAGQDAIARLVAGAARTAAESAP